MAQLFHRENLLTHNLFFNPPNYGGGESDYDQDAVYQRGAQLPVTWATNYTNYEVQLWRQWIGGGGADQGPTVYTSTQPPSSEYAVQKLDWTVQYYNFNLSKSPVFFFWARANDEGLFSSHYFNISDTPLPSVSTQSTIPTLPTSTAVTSHKSPASIPWTSSVAYPQTKLRSSTSIFQSSTLTHTPTPRSISTATAATTTGLSSTAKVGIGLGAGIAILLVALCFVSGCRFARRRSARMHQDPRSSASPPSYARSQRLVNSHQQHVFELGGPEPKELSARRTIVELPTVFTPRVRSP